MVNDAVVDQIYSDDKNIKEDDYSFLTHIKTIVGCDYVLTLNQQIFLKTSRWKQFLVKEATLVSLNANRFSGSHNS